MPLLHNKMGLFDQDFSDYGSGSSLESAASLGRNIKKSHKIEKPVPLRPICKANNSFVSTNKNSLEDVMQEFRMNGLDTSYEPDEDIVISNADYLIGLGTSSVYLRQKSWPEPERTPALRLPRPSKSWIPAPTHKKSLSDVPVYEPPQFTPAFTLQDITPDQVRVLNSLPNKVLYSLLRDLEQERQKVPRQPLECRFCKNNGERESYYRSHQLKDEFGRVVCPVLRALVCSRCGASGDNAHTQTHCPYISYEERRTSAARMRSMRMASGRRRVSAPSVTKNPNSMIYYDQTIELPLDPLWEALEQKLTI